MTLWVIVFNILWSTGMWRKKYIITVDFKGTFSSFCEEMLNRKRKIFID